MAKVNVKVFGVYRVDSGVKEYVAEATTVNDVFTSLNYLSKSRTPISISITPPSL